MSDAPAGWYPDPTPATPAPSLRYWDGQAWTEHVAPGAQPSTPQYPGTSPYAAAPAGPTTPDGVPLAGWGIRVAAYLIDLLPIMLVGFLFSVTQGAAQERQLRQLEHELAETGDMAAFWDGWLTVMADSIASDWPLFVVTSLYFILLWRFKGATLGKLALGLRVRLRDQPGTLPWSAIVLRFSVFYGVSILAQLSFVTGSWMVIVVAWLAALSVFFLDSLWPLWDPKRQALHDKVARTNVVKIR